MSTAEHDNLPKPVLYVLLCSRVKSMEGLCISGDIHPKALRADPKVVKFYSSLQLGHQHHPAALVSCRC
jgi:hypothetical protein